MSKLFITCDEATTICNKNQYKEATFIEKIKLNIHIFSCKVCGLYSKQNATITKVCNKHLHNPTIERKLSADEKEELHCKVVEKMK